MFRTVAMNHSESMAMDQLCAVMTGSLGIEAKPHSKQHATAQAERPHPARCLAKASCRLSHADLRTGSSRVLAARMFA